MKRFSKSITFMCIMVAFIAIFALTGCDKTDKKLQSMQDNISYYNEQLLAAEDDNFYVEVVCGGREKTLIADGEVGEMADYCALNITPINVDMTNRALTFKLTGEGGEYQGNLEKSIVGINYTAQISDFRKLGKITKLVVSLGEENFEYALADVNADGIDYKKAVESVYKNCAADLEGMFDGNKFMSEIYIKVSCDRSKEPKQYYWFVNVVENSDNMFCVLVDMQTGEIVAKKHK